MSSRTFKSLAVAGAMAAVAAAAPTVAGASPESASTTWINRQLTPSSTVLAKCMPHARVNVSVGLTTDAIGYDTFRVRASGLPKNTAFTVFLLEKAASPFGAAEYIGDFTSNSHGVASNEFRLIVAEAFSSTLVGTTRVRKELNQIGAWFADEKADDFCLGRNSPVTPFDGDNAAGVQAFNSANARPLP